MLNLENVNAALPGRQIPDIWVGCLTLDGVDSGSPGFVVIADVPPMPVPVLAQHGIIALIDVLCVVGVSRIRRRFN